MLTRIPPSLVCGKKVNNLQSAETEPLVKASGVFLKDKGGGGERFCFCFFNREVPTLVHDWFISMPMRNPNTIVPIGPNSTVLIGQLCALCFVVMELLWLVRINANEWQSSNGQGRAQRIQLNDDTRSSLLRFTSENRSSVQQAWKLGPWLFPEIQHLWEASVSNGC